MSIISAESNICVIEQHIIEVNRQKKYMRKYEGESYDGMVHCAKWEKKCGTSLRTFSTSTPSDKYAFSITSY